MLYHYTETVQKTTETCIFIAINLKGQSIPIPRTFGRQIHIKCVLVMCARLHIIRFASLPYLKFLRNKAIKHSFLCFPVFQLLAISQSNELSSLCLVTDYLVKSLQPTYSISVYILLLSSL